METDPATNPYAPPKAESGAGGDGETPLLTDHEIDAFVARNTTYYRDAWFDANRTGGFCLGFSWAAFFLGTFWLGYRRLYLEMVVAMASELCLVLVVGRLAPALFVGSTRWLFTWGPKAVVGFLGNGLYLARARRVTREARREPDRGNCLAQIGYQGGVSWVGVLIAVGTWALWAMGARLLFLR